MREIIKYISDKITDFKRFSYTTQPSDQEKVIEKIEVSGDGIVTFTGTDNIFNIFSPYLKNIKRDPIFCKTNIDSANGGVSYGLFDFSNPLKFEKDIDYEYGLENYICQENLLAGLSGQQSRLLTPREFSSLVYSVQTKKNGYIEILLPGGKEELFAEYKKHYDLHKDAPNNAFSELFKFVMGGVLTAYFNTLMQAYIKPLLIQKLSENTVGKMELIMQLGKTFVSVAILMADIYAKYCLSSSLALATILSLSTNLFLQPILIAMGLDRQYTDGILTGISNLIAVLSSGQWVLKLASNLGLAKFPTILGQGLAYRTIKRLPPLKNQEDCINEVISELITYRRVNKKDIFLHFQDELEETTLKLIQVEAINNNIYLLEKLFKTLEEIWLYRKKLTPAEKNEFFEYYALHLIPVIKNLEDAKDVCNLIPKAILPLIAKLFKGEVHRFSGFSLTKTLEAAKILAHYKQKKEEKILTLFFSQDNGNTIAPSNTEMILSN